MYMSATVLIKLKINYILTFKPTSLFSLKKKKSLQVYLFTHHNIYKPILTILRKHIIKLSLFFVFLEEVVLLIMITFTF